MARRPHGPQDQESRNKKFLWILLIALLLVTSGVLYLLIKAGKLTDRPGTLTSEKREGLARTPGNGVPDSVRRPVPPREPTPPPPQSPPEVSVPSYPDVPPQASPEERKEAFGLKSSVDHVVQAQEPFTVHGRQWTVEGIQERLAASGPQARQTAERESLGGLVQKPGSKKSTEAEQQGATVYYGIHWVRPGENLWEIHYAIVREYFARRAIELPPRSDQTRPDGRSTGVGRILKFLESVVYVYDTRGNRPVEDVNFLHPNDLIVFFKISEVFAALDHVNPEDLNALRYVGPTLQMKAVPKSRVLLHQKDLMDQPPLPVPEKAR